MIHLQDCLNKFDLKNQKYFLFVGSIQPRKNLTRLITAYKVFLDSISTGNGEEYRVSSIRYKGKDRHSSIRYTCPTILPPLVLAGSKGWLSDDIYTLPKKLGIEDYVKFLGFVPDQDLPALYRGSLGFLFPSLFEGFGLPILEAMASGCPVLTSNTSSLPEVAGKAALLVDPESETEIAQGILKLFLDEKLRNKLKKMGIAQSQKFSWKKAAEETLNLFKIDSK